MKRPLLSGYAPASEQPPSSPRSSAGPPPDGAGPPPDGAPVLSDLDPAGVRSSALPASDVVRARLRRPPKVTVVSTGWGAPAQAARMCRDTVAAQMNVAFEHVYIEDPAPKLQNLHRAIAALPADRIVALVDGDDWLCRPDALELVAALYRERDCWLTYGQFRYARGAPGFAAPYPKGVDYRRGPWLATHLKTFRAGLFQRIELEDLKYLGAWRDRADDVAFMVPMLEMAGPDRVAFNPVCVYVYNFDASFQKAASKDEQAYEHRLARSVAELPAYARLEAL